MERDPTRRQNRKQGISARATGALGIAPFLLNVHSSPQITSTAHYNSPCCNTRVGPRLRVTPLVSRPLIELQPKTANSGKPHMIYYAYSI